MIKRWPDIHFKGFRGRHDEFFSSCRNKDRCWSIIAEMNISNFDTLLTSDILATAIVYSCSAASVIRSSRPLHPLSFSSCFEFQLIWSGSSQRWREVKSLILNEMLSTFKIPSGMSNERNSLMISRFGIVRRFGDIPYHFHSFPEYSLIFFLYKLYINTDNW